MSRPRAIFVIVLVFLVCHMLPHRGSFFYLNTCFQHMFALAVDSRFSLILTIVQISWNPGAEPKHNLLIIKQTQ